MLLHTHTVLSFILGLTAAGMFVHLWRLQQPVNAKKWLMAFYLGLFIWQVENVVRYSMPIGYFETLLYKFQTVFVLIPMLALAHVAHSQYAYRFLVPVYPYERKLVFRISIGLSIAEFLFVAWNEFVADGSIAVTLVSAFFYSSIYTFWIIFLCLRKARYLRPTHKEASTAHYVYAGINGCYVAAAIFSIIFGFFSVPGFWSYFSFVWLGNLASIVLYIVTAAVPANFQSKITGFGFVLAASALTIITLALNPPVFLEDTAARVAQQPSLRRLLIITNVVVLMIVLLMPFMLRFSLTKPLLRLLEGVKKVNEGNLDTQVEEGLPDEIGQLTRHFNIMTRNLQKAHKELTDYAQTLEKKVNRRTAQLQSSLTELKALQAQLIQAEKIASLGELTAGIAHELKNPLNFINNFSDVTIELAEELETELKSTQPDVENIRAIAADVLLNLERIAHHGKRADAIVQGMLEHGRTARGERQQTDINQLVSENLKDCYDQLLRQHKVEETRLYTHFDESLAITADGNGALTMVKQDIGRALSNIYNNAFYAVTLKKKKVGNDFEPAIKVTTRKVEKAVEISIADNGIGIPPAIANKIFQPFFTTKPTGEGTGMGLSLCHDIIKAHGGEIKVNSKEGEGSEFIVRLPVLTPEFSSSLA